MKISTYLYLLLSLAITPLFAEKIVVASMAIGHDYNLLVQGSYENKRDYCKRRGYGFRFEHESWDLDRPIPWSKILIILDIMQDSDVKWIMWSDADSLITNYHIRIKDFIDKRYDMIVASDCSGINTGQFIIRNCRWSREFLAKVYDRREFINHGWWEQAAIMDEYANSDEVKKHIKVLHQRAMNSYAAEYNPDNYDVKWQPYDFIVHFAGIRGTELYNLMQLYRERVIK